jgi:hypothetical protein
MPVGEEYFTAPDVNFFIGTKETLLFVKFVKSISSTLNFIIKTRTKKIMIMEIE